MHECFFQDGDVSNFVLSRLLSLELQKTLLRIGLYWQCNNELEPKWSIFCVLSCLMSRHPVRCFRVHMEKISLYLCTMSNQSTRLTCHVPVFLFWENWGYTLKTLLISYFLVKTLKLNICPSKPHYHWYIISP
jgi:hypothetical protein